MLVLVLGDLCVPLGSQDLPLKFKRLLVPGKISKILVTGNLTSPSVLDYLRTISQDISTVQGSLDAPCTQVPAERVVTLGNLRLGLIHGSAGLLPWGHPSALETKARQLDVDILLHGFGSGFEARETDGRFYVNPGSATGVYWHKMPRIPSEEEQASVAESATENSAGSSTNVEPTQETTTSPAQDQKNQGPPSIPSFVLMDAQESTVTFYIYKLIGGEVKVEKLDFTKKLFD